MSRKLGNSFLRFLARPSAKKLMPSPEQLREFLKFNMFRKLLTLPGEDMGYKSQTPASKIPATPARCYKAESVLRETLRANPSWTREKAVQTVAMSTRLPEATIAAFGKNIDRDLEVEAYNRKHPRFKPALA